MRLLPANHTPQRRYSRHAQTSSSQDVDDWRASLDYPTYEITKATLADTNNISRTNRLKLQSILKIITKLDYRFCNHNVYIIVYTLILSFPIYHMLDDSNAFDYLQVSNINIIKQFVYAVNPIHQRYTKISPGLLVHLRAQ